jgi:hypothetical protein
MIDFQSENIITFSQAADELPRRRRGRKTHVSTLFRWSTIGCRGVVLETLKMGGTRCTSREALQRFFERLSNTRQGVSVGKGQSRSDACADHPSIARSQCQASRALRAPVKPGPSGKVPGRTSRAMWVRILTSRTFRAIATGVGAFWAFLRLALLALEHFGRH